MSPSSERGVSQMKKFKLDEIAYEKAINTLAKSLIAMVQEDYEEEFESMGEEDVKAHLHDTVEEYTCAVILELSEAVAKYID
jgi:hypothetical protein